MAAALLAPTTVLAQGSAASAQVKRGEYLVNIGGLPRLSHALGDGARWSGAGHEAGAVRPSARHVGQGACGRHRPVDGRLLANADGVVGPVGRELFCQPHARRGNRRAAGFYRAAVHPDDAHGQASGPGPANSSADAVAIYRPNDRRRSEGGLRLSSADPAVKNKVPDPIPPAK